MSRALFNNGFSASGFALARLTFYLQAESFTWIQMVCTWSREATRRCSHWVRLGHACCPLHYWTSTLCIQKGKTSFPKDGKWKWFPAAWGVMTSFKDLIFTWDPVSLIMDHASEFCFCCSLTKRQITNPQWTLSLQRDCTTSKTSMSWLLCPPALYPHRLSSPVVGNTYYAL